MYVPSFITCDLSLWMKQTNIWLEAPRGKAGNRSNLYLEEIFGIIWNQMIKIGMGYFFLPFLNCPIGSFVEHFGCT